MAGDGGGARDLAVESAPARGGDGRPLSFSPSETNDKLGQSHALSAIEDALKYQRCRVWLSQAEIEPIQWIFIFLLSAVIMIPIATTERLGATPD